MQSLQPAGLPASGPKNYVFVDEHNRHKRLKVMRACEGCRRRKIKCDAATTNSWPCAACKRLKLTCVPPVGGMEGDLNTLDPNIDTFIAQPSGTPARQFPQEQFHYIQNYGSQSDLDSRFSSYDAGVTQGLYNQQDFDYRQEQHDPTKFATPHHSSYPQPSYSSYDSVNGHLAPQSIGSPHSTESVTVEDLAENLGDLWIADTGIAPYIRQQNGSQHEPPAPIAEDEEDLPAFPTTAGSQIRIPPALMPSEDDASKSFQDFFKHVHPYVPVLCRHSFLQQWQHDRDSISPLLLEAVLACGGQVSDDPAGGFQWLALANRHEENFVDTPRLSTIQALMLLLKAREKTPKRGYYYRSWITVKKIVGMAKDLDLHEHYDIHESGGQCDSTAVDCLTKTRIWQLAMIIEIMVGGPQGRSDYGVDIDTIDVRPDPPNSDIDDYEKSISRQFAYWVRNVRNIRGMTETYHKLKRKNKDWATDPKFVAYNEDLRKWPGEIPDDLKVSNSLGQQFQKLPSHFLANMHCHYQLGIVMLYKPQLTASKDFDQDEKWKHIMSVCYNSAKQICAFQEAIIAQFDVLGLACMMRGLSFPIYAILSCVMIHLIAITSPDGAYNQDAKEYFIRHMRVLERCIAEWPMPEVEAQINGLRTAFSADLSKPFDLKPTFPYGTPSEQSRSPVERRSSEPQPQSHSVQSQQFYQQQMPHTSYFPTPPVSAGPITKSQEHHFYQDYHSDHTGHQYHQMPPTSNPSNAVTPNEQWNPTPIINQFNTAFAIPQSALAPPPPSNYSSSPPVTMQQQNYHAVIQNQHYIASPTPAGGYGHGHGQQQPYTAPSVIHQPIPTTQSFLGTHHQNTSQPQPITTQFTQPQTGTSYFDAGLDQHGSQQHHMPRSQGYGTSHSFTSSSETTAAIPPVYVTPKEWQQSVASVFDPSGLKRKWAYDQQLDLEPQAQRARQYGAIG